MLIRFWHRFEEGAIAALLAAMTLLTFTQVVLRYAFNSGFVWALEATTYLFGWLVLFGMSYGIRVGGHIGVDVLVQRLGPCGQRLVGILAALLSALYAAILLVGSWNYISTMRMIGVEAEDIPVERWLLSIILPIGFLLLLARLLDLTWRIFRGTRPGFHLADEAQVFIDQFDAGADSQARRP